MEKLGDGLVTLLNGLLGMVDALFSPLSFVILLLAVSIVWLCLVEIDEMDRQGSKPEVPRH